MISTFQNLLKQTEAIADIDTNLNLDHMSPSYKSMPNEKLVYQRRPGKLYKTRKEAQKKKKVNPTTEEKSKISADLLNKDVKLKSKDLPVFDIESKERKSEANCKRSKKMFKIQKDTDDIVPDLKVKSVTTPLIKYGCHNLSYLSLKSLETHCQPSCISDIKKTDPYFRVKWLHDEIVHSCLFLLELKFSHVLYCGSVEARTIVAGKSMKCLWKIQQLFNKELVFVPYNPSGVHLLLIVLNLLQCTIMLLDPMLEDNTSDIELVMEIGIKLLKNKFSLQNVTAIPANKHSYKKMVQFVGLMFAIMQREFVKVSQCFFSSKVFAHAYF